MIVLTTYKSNVYHAGTIKFNWLKIHYCFYLNYVLLSDDIFVIIHQRVKTYFDPKL